MTARIVLLLTALLFATALPAMELEIAPEISNTGTFNIHWQGSDGARYDLIEQRADGDSHIVYRGSDTARVMTGLPNGRYSYRVRTEHGGDPGPWSEPAAVTVAHHPLTRAFAFFGVGLLVFLATIALILRGERD
jgi:hypothetical protein